MPARLVRLRIAGFKSFAEPVSVEILPGLTGIVGPNGCGKSNVVEALRWAMGESSARALRGGEMDELIFAGSAARPARNLAEVVLTLEDAAGLAPPPFHEQAELQIGRRIERGAGSAFRINNREARARDIQTLFADLNSGARASAMISQGRVAAIIGARPEERRSVLEEAAGTTGLQARRHEAELRLRAADANLSRAADLRRQLDAQLASLAVQAEQAGRYRAVAQALRDGEAELLALLHARAARAVERTAAGRLAAADALARAERTLAEAATAERLAGNALPGPREAEAIARGLLERRRIEHEGAAADGERAATELRRAVDAVAQANSDRNAAAARLEDAETATARLHAERDALDAAARALPDAAAAVAGRLAALRAALRDADPAAQHATERAAKERTRHAEAARDLESAGERLARAVAGRDRLRAETAARTASMPDPALMTARERALAAAGLAAEAADRSHEQQLEQLADATRNAERDRLDAAEQQRRHQTATATLRAENARIARLLAEHDALHRRLLQAENTILPDATRQAARAATGEAAEALATASRALDAAETARGIRSRERLEAESRWQDAARHRNRLDAAQRDLEAAHQRVRDQAEALRRDRAAAAAALVPAETLAAARTARADAEHGRDARHRALDAAEALREAANTAAVEAAGRLAALRDTQSRLAAEADGTAQALAGNDPADAQWRSLADGLEVPAGLEAALAAFLAEGLDAAHPEAAEGAPAAWAVLPGLEPAPLPAGTTGLDRLLAAPEALARALSHAGLLPDGVDGAALQERLHPGQCLVRRDGALWRWDGFRIGANRPGPAARRLTQRARLRQLRNELDRAEAALPAARAAQANAAAERERILDAARAARLARDQADEVLARLRDQESRLAREDAETRGRHDALAPQHDNAVLAEAEAAAALRDAAATRAELPNDVLLCEALDTARRREHDALAVERDARDARRGTEAGLAQARDAETAALLRHNEGVAARDSLVPLLGRAANETALARQAQDVARAALAELDPNGAQARRLHSEAALDRAAGAARAAHETRRIAADHLATGRDARDRALADLLENRARLEALRLQSEAADTEHQAAEQVVARLEAARTALPDPALSMDAARRAVERCTTLRGEEQEQAAAAATLAAEQAGLAARRPPLVDDFARWQVRRDAARIALDDAAFRLDTARDAQARHAAGPAEAAKRALALANALQRAEQAHQDARQVLDRAETHRDAAQAARHAADSALGAAREQSVLAGSRDEQARALQAQLLAEGTPPPGPVPGDLSDGAEAALRRRVARCRRERDAIGPVNLRAEAELAEARAHIAVIAHETAELEGAIAALRGQIGQLDREGRERLVAIFTEVDRQFRALFARMFNGGRAHLGLVGSDDPLGAGLEIYAQPPGKKLSTLSLLSGGEQALCALSLVFAVFRCNPAPVCVLDEVDAPLDDANVERFCALLADMVRETGTRFLVVTHHQSTMAHMDRLYGVTMQERGVSRVLSVDLAAASEMAG